MQWDLGFQGVALLAVISAGFGAAAALMVGRDLVHRLRAAAITTAACIGAGLVSSEVVFGWATEEELQPNVDGLSRDEVLLSSVLTTAAVVLVMRRLAQRTADRAGHEHHWAPRSRYVGGDRRVR